MKERITQLMELVRMNPTQFANAIGVQRTTMQHILSGRNEPSLKIITAIYKRFPDISIDWLLSGKGEPLTSPDIRLSHTDVLQQSLFNIVDENQKNANTDVYAVKNAIHERQTRSDNVRNKTVDKTFAQRVDTSTPKQIKEVLVLFTDGTFEFFSSVIKN